MGGELLYGWRMNKDNSTGNAAGIRVSTKYDIRAIAIRERMIEPTFRHRAHRGGYEALSCY